MTDIQSYSESRKRLLALYREQKFWDAYRLVEDLLTRYPASMEFLVQRATIIQLLNAKGNQELPSLSLAMQSLKEARELAPDAVEPLLELGHFAYAVNDDSAAGLEYFESAEEIAEAGLKEALVGQIRCHLDRGNRAQADRLLQRARLLFPDDDEVQMLHDEFED